MTENCNLFGNLVKTALDKLEDHSFPESRYLAETDEQREFAQVTHSDTKPKSMCRVQGKVVW